MINILNMTFKAIIILIIIIIIIIIIITHETCVLVIFAHKRAGRPLESNCMLEIPHFCIYKNSIKFLNKWLN